MSSRPSSTPESRLTIHYSIEELLELRETLPFVICPIDEFKHVAWSDGLLEKIGEYEPMALAIRKSTAMRIANAEDERREFLRKVEYKAHSLKKTFEEHLKVGKYGVPTSGRAASGTSSQQPEAVFSLMGSSTAADLPNTSVGVSTKGPIQEKEAEKEHIPGGEVDEENTAGGEMGETGEENTPGESFIEENVPEEEAGGKLKENIEPKVVKIKDVVDQDAWIKAMLAHTNALEMGKYKN